MAFIVAFASLPYADVMAMPTSMRAKIATKIGLKHEHNVKIEGEKMKSWRKFFRRMFK